MRGDPHLLLVLLDRSQEVITLLGVRVHYDRFLCADLAWQAR
jgi:hypothetical protein